MCCQADELRPNMGVMKVEKDGSVLKTILFTIGNWPGDCPAEAPVLKAKKKSMKQPFRPMLPSGGFCLVMTGMAELLLQRG
jgi:hypothetical protein